MRYVVLENWLLGFGKVLKSLEIFKRIFTNPGECMVNLQQACS